MTHLLRLFLGIFALLNPVLASELQTVKPEQLQSMQQQNQALVVDIRTETEWQATGVIANSYKLEAFDPQGRFDEEKWLADLQKLKASPEQPVILVCRSGNRSSKVGNFLIEKIGMKNVYHLQNGLQSWMQSGLPVTSNCLTISCK